MTEPEDHTSLAALVSLSKAALQHGEQIGSTANELSKKSPSFALEVQLIDARVRWMTNGILEQLQLASTIAKSLEQRQTLLLSDIRKWDVTREQRSSNLDKILDRLSLQQVPPQFHQAASDEASAIFGSTFDDEPDPKDVSKREDIDGTITLNGHRDDQLHTNPSSSRHKWRTLRDFIDEKGILDSAEAMDEDRIAIDDLLATRADNPNALMQQIESFKDAISPTLQDLAISELFNKQETVINGMATHLESLATHFDQVNDALKLSESGETLHQDDMDVFIRDTNELPSVTTELEEAMSAVLGIQEQLSNHKKTAHMLLAKHPALLGVLDDLSANMTLLVNEQETLEAEVDDFRNKLQSHLETLDELCSTYESYQLSFNVLILEFDRRKRWTDDLAVEIDKMKSILADYRDTEMQRRESFMTTYGGSLPADLCLPIADIPAKYEIARVSEPSNSTATESVIHGHDTATHGSGVESIPSIPEDILTEARSRVEQARLLES